MGSEEGQREGWKDGGRALKGGGGMKLYEKARVGVSDLKLFNKLVLEYVAGSRDD